MEWKKFKASKIKELKDHEKQNKTDERIMDLVHAINSSPDFVTTSSCEGRINLLEYDINEGKKSSNFYKKWHHVVDHNAVELAISEYVGKTPLWFKVEPFILHVAARNITAAVRFLKLVRSIGVKRGGIQSISKDKVMIEIQGNGYMAIPVEPFNGEWNKIITIANKMINNNLEVVEKMEKLKWK